MLTEHKKALIESADLRAVTYQLEKEEQERHQQRLKQITSSEAEARLILNCLQDPEAAEAGMVARAYIKVWAAKMGIDLEKLQEQQKELNDLCKTLMKEAGQK